MDRSISNPISDPLAESDALTIARLIKRYSLRRGWRMDELALRAGVSRTTIYQLLRGAIRKPRHSTLHKIAAALQIPLAYLQHDFPIADDSFCDQHDHSVSKQLQHKRKVDRAANAIIDTVQAEHPEHFSDWQEQHWDELYSTFGVGGALTYDGVLDRAEQINHNRETLRKLQLVLETHLSGLAEQVVHTLYQLIAVQQCHTTDSDDLGSIKLTELLNDMLMKIDAIQQEAHCQEVHS